MAEWELLRVKASATPNYRTVIQDKLNQVKPRADGVFGILVGGDEFHFWMRADGNGPTYTLTTMNPAYIGTAWESKVTGMLRAKSMMFVGVNRSNPPDFWYLAY